MSWWINHHLHGFTNTTLIIKIICISYTVLVTSALEKDRHVVSGQDPEEEPCRTNATSAAGGMQLPFTPLSIAFSNIRYSVEIPKVSCLQNLYLISSIS
jgi:hypothetical protein